MPKKIVVYEVDGRERELTAIPKFPEIQKLVGGHVEIVSVLDRVEHGRFIYCPMFVHEEGLILKLPRNEKATALYQANVRKQFPDAPNPFEEAAKRWRARFPVEAVHIDGTPADAVAAGYKSDPWIAGTAIVFHGYSVEEVDEEVTS